MRARSKHTGRFLADSIGQRFAMGDRASGRTEGDVIEGNVATTIDGAAGRTGQEYRNECDLRDCQIDCAN